jgi:DNA-binding HxlR family transcriptional regulator/putative sterol carrier protein
MTTMTRRTYDQYCSLARALEIVGERWTLLVVRELLPGPRRYSDLLEGLPGIGGNVLSARLKSLQAAGVIRRTRLPAPAASVVYELTEVGERLQPALLALSRWGMAFLGAPRPGDRFRPSWVLLGMRATFDAEAAAGVSETYELHIDGETFHARVEDGTVDIRQGPAPEPDVAMELDPDTFLAVGTRELAAEDAIASGRIRLTGDEEAALRCARLFALPEAEAPAAAEIAEAA